MEKQYRKSNYVHAVYRKEHADWLLYNFSTRRFLILDEFKKLIYDGAPYDDISSPFLKSLYDNGFLVDYDEYDSLVKRQLKRQEEDSYVHLGIAPTMGCNFRCADCIETGQIRSGRMTAEVSDKVIAFAKKLLKGAKGLSLIWFGGEPMLAMDVLSQIGSALKTYCDEHALAFNSAIYTNGLFLSENNIRLLESIGVDTIRISVDGSRESHDRMRFLPGGSGSYDKILENLSVPTKMTYRIRCNMRKDNLSDYETLVDNLQKTHEKSGNRIIVSSERMRVEKEVNSALKELELSYPEYYDFFQKNRTLKVSEDKEKILSLLKGKSTGVTCNATRKKSFQIDEQGNIYKCNWFLGKAEHVIGNVAENPGFHELNNTEEAGYFLSRVIADREKCRNCVMLPVCLGRCPLSWEIEGKYDCMRDINSLNELLPLAYEAYKDMKS